MRALAVKWTSHLKDAKSKKDFEAQLRNSTTVTARLTSLLKEMEEEALRTPSTDYDSASWAYKQADNNGYRRAVREILDLFKFMEK